MQVRWRKPPGGSAGSCGARVKNWSTTQVVRGLLWSEGLTDGRARRWTAQQLSALVKWSDLQVAKVVDDFQDDKVPEEGTWRCFSRIVVVLILAALVICAFLYIFIFLTPNTRTDRVYLQNRHKDYAITTYYNSTAAYGRKINDVNETSSTEFLVSCPCTWTTISWTNFTHFYLINNTRGQLLYNFGPDNRTFLSFVYNETRVAWYHAYGDPYLGTIPIDPKYLNRTFALNNIDDVSWNLCPHVTLLSASYPYGPYSNVDYCKYFVLPFVTTEVLDDFSAMQWKDDTVSYIPTPVLLDQKFLYANTIRLLKAQLRTQYALPRVNFDFWALDAQPLQQFVTGLAQSWISVLNSFADNSSTNDSFYFHRAATDLRLKASSDADVMQINSSVVLLDDSGQSVLGMNMSWMEYYRQCQPVYCDVTKPNSLLRQIIIVLAQVGGLLPLALFLVRSILWPLLAMLIGNM